MKACGSLSEVTEILPAPDLIGKIGFTSDAYRKALRVVKQPWDYVRQRASRGECAIVTLSEEHMLVITKRLTVVIDPRDLYIYDAYASDVELKIS